MNSKNGVAEVTCGRTVLYNSVLLLLTYMIVYVVELERLRLVQLLNYKFLSLLIS